MNKETYIREIDKVCAQGPFEPNWPSLSTHKDPEWYRNDKLGIFIHWGIYSVPAGNEWYSRCMYDTTDSAYQKHLENWGSQKDFGYKDFIPRFTAEKFDADAWVGLFKEAGARFVVPVCEHHDGFAMYRTFFNRWNACLMGPKRDVVGEIKAACERAGLEFGGSNHRAEHYFFMNPGRSIDSDVNDPAYADFYGPAVMTPALDETHMTPTSEDTYGEGPTDAWMEDWMVRVCELIDNYKPHLLYFDWWIHNQAFKPYLKKIACYYYNRAAEWGAEVSIIYKHEAFPPGVATFDVERGALTGICERPWQTDTAIGKRSWGYRSNNTYKSARQVITDFVDVVSKNGRLLLNTGPKPDGTITEEETAVLKSLGAWLKANGEGIYGTTHWTVFGEGKVNNEAGFFQDGTEKDFTNEDFRFTYKNGYLYAFQMRPNGGDMVIRTLKKKNPHDFLIESVTLLESGEALKFERTEEGLRIFARPEFQSEMPVGVRLEIG